MKKMLSLIFVLALMLSMTASLAEESPVVITIGKQFDVSGKTFPEGHSADGYNYYLDYAEQRSGVKVEYSWFLADDSQKTSLAVASGDMPDVMMVDQVTYNMLLQSDMLLDLTDAYQAVAPGTILEEVYSVYPESFEAAQVGGRLMSLPNAVAQYENAVLWVRQDWLDNLGLEAPSTLEELEAVARAFVEQDPDGNGEADTIGLALMPEVFSEYNSSNCAGAIAALYNAYPKIWYQQEDGSVIYGSVAEGTRSALEWLAKMYAEGIVDREFAVHEAKELVVSGKCGLTYGRWAYACNELQQSHAFDGADWVPVLCPLNEEGIYNARFRAPSSVYVVVSKKCEHPEKVLEIIKNEYEFHWYVDLDEEWTERRKEYDNMGVHWGIMPIAIQLERTSIVEERCDAFVQYIENGSREGLSAQCQGFIDTYDQWVEDNTQLGGWAWYKGMYQCGKLTTSDRCAYTVPCFWGTTDTMEDLWATLLTLEEETFVKIVMGEADITAFDAFVEQWNAQGGAIITAEVQEYVDAR